MLSIPLQGPFNLVLCNPLFELIIDREGDRFNGQAGSTGRDVGSNRQSAVAEKGIRPPFAQFTRAKTEAMDTTREANHGLAMLH